MSDMRRFNLVSNGYDCYQVNNEIDRLEYHINELNEKIMIYQNQIETVNNQFSQIKKRYQDLVSELSMREKQADDVTRLALKEANVTIESAQKNADIIISEATNTINDYFKKINDFNDKQRGLRTQVRQNLQILSESLDELDNIEIPNPFEEK